MKKEFTPYEQALALKELGFDEPCFGIYTVSNKKLFIVTPSKDESFGYLNTPTYSQAFRWFREKYSYYHSIYYHKSSKFECRVSDESDKKLSNKLFGNTYLNHEEVELECLKELIKIVVNKKGSI